MPEPDDGDDDGEIKEPLPHHHWEMAQPCQVRPEATGGTPPKHLGEHPHRTNIWSQEYKRYSKGFQRGGLTGCGHHAEARHGSLITSISQMIHKQAQVNVGAAKHIRRERCKRTWRPQ